MRLGSPPLRNRVAAHALRTLHSANRDAREDVIEDLRKLVAAASCAADCADLPARDANNLADLQNALQQAAEAVERLRG